MATDRLRAAIAVIEEAALGGLDAHRAARAAIRPPLRTFLEQLRHELDVALSALPCPDSELSLEMLCDTLDELPVDAEALARNLEQALHNQPARATETQPSNPL